MGKVIEETKITKQIMIVESNTGEILQKVCKDCGHLKLAEEFPKNGERLRPYCKDCWRERQRAYYEGIKLKRSVYRHRARAKEVGLADTLTEEQLKELLAHANGRCMLTGEPATESDPLTIDHVTALGNRFSLGNAPCNIILAKRSLNFSRKEGCLLKFIGKYPEKVNPEKTEETISYLSKQAGVEKADFIRLLEDIEEFSKKEGELNEEK
ncbi:hypothetical protein K8O68_07700 [Salipaludibacillus sp. CUR1]|uniref:hypothetical protein n=1 Tax=Salipaludibacillus sp. CUR1 TaxID=2820003 RepID=UPI001E44B622|nr:hypothetical protein [Salipaludibacillus sp. CUR1]MCE7792303.1 hypothetical protein [Salipaludibacillus sp. CUR1]